MSNEYEYWESHPEIRKDLDIVLECDNFRTWVAWNELYKNLPNVKVVIKMKGQTA